MQLYVIWFFSDLGHVSGFYPGTPVSSTNTTDRHDIAEILLKVTLNTMTPFERKKPPVCVLFQQIPLIYMIFF